MFAESVAERGEPPSSVGVAVDGYGWSTAGRLVVLAAQTTVDDPEQLRSLAADVDWRRVLTYTRAHGVVPAVVESLSEHCEDITPGDVLAELGAEQQRIARSNLNLTRELRDVVSELRARDIDVLPYKGPVLSADVYGDIGSRQFGDIDLLVRQDRIPDIKAYLEERGYVPQYERAETDRLSSGQEWAYTHYRRDYPFYRAETDTMIELQWRIVDGKFPTDIQLETVWDRRSSTTVAGMDIPVLSPEDRLLVLSVHGTRHYWERLEWIRDIVKTIETQSIDWEMALSRARAHNAERMFLLGPAIANRVYGVELPETVRSRIASDPRIDPLLDRALERLFEDEPGQISLHRFQAKALDRYRDKAYLLLWWSFVPTRSEIELVALPRQLSFLYYLVRPLRLLLLPFC